MLEYLQNVEAGMRKWHSLSRAILGAVCFSAVSSASAATCSDPAPMDDPRVLVEPCSAVISDLKASEDQRVRALEYRARAYRFEKNFSAAMDDVNAAMSLRPNDAALYSVRSMINHSWRQPAAAWVDGMKAIDLQPNEPLYYYRLIDFFTDYNLLDQAKELLDHVEIEFPSHLGLRLSKIWYYRAKLDHHQMVAAINSFFQSTTETERNKEFTSWHGRRMQGDVPLLIYLSEALVYDYQWDAALQAAERAVAIKRDVTTLTARAWVHKSWPSDGRPSNHAAAALADIDAAIAADPTLPRAHSVRGHILLYAQQFEEALASTNEAIRLYPDDDTQLWQRFLIQRSLNNSTEAEKDIVKYASNYANMPNVLSKLRRYGYWFGSEMPTTMTPLLLAGVRACAQDEGCW